MELKLKHIFTIISIFIYVMFAGTGTEPKRTSSETGARTETFLLINKVPEPGDGILRQDIKI